LLIVVYFVSHTPRRQWREERQQLIQCIHLQQLELTQRSVAAHERAADIAKVSRRVASAVFLSVCSHARALSEVQYVVHVSKWSCVEPLFLRTCKCNLCITALTIQEFARAIECFEERLVIAESTVSNEMLFMRSISETLLRAATGSAGANAAAAGAASTALATQQRPT
jgi:hypothetical protein